MNFTNHYFNEEEQIDEAGEIIGKIQRAIGAGAARGVANIVRGALGRMKNIAFNPKWLKVLRPVTQANYKKAQNIYSSWRNKKTKLGPKESYSIVDVGNGVFGEFSKKGGKFLGATNYLTKKGRNQANEQANDELISILKKYDSTVPADKINMSADIKPQITIYLLNNRGKIIFFNLPIGDDGKKRYYAMGLDNKAERAFTLIHGMRFDDFVMDPSEEAGSEAAEQKEKEKAGIGKIIGKVKISPNKYKELAPESRKYKNQLIERTNFLLDLFEDEVLEATENIVKVIKKDDEWVVANTGSKVTPDLVKKNKDLEYKAFEKKSDVQFDNTLDLEFKQWLKDQDSGKAEGGDSEEPKPEDKKGEAGNSEESKPEDKKGEAGNSEESKPEDKGGEKQDVTNGKLYDEIKNELKGEPSKVKPDDKQEGGWRYALNNQGVLFLYKSLKDKKYYLSYNKPAEKIAKSLIDKFGLTSAPESPEE